MIDQNKFDLLRELVKTSFKMRYQNSVLGFLWVLIKPYAMFGVMYAIFSHIIRANVENYALYLLTGVIFITFVNELLILGQMSLLERAHIILKVNFPRQIAILSALIGSLINLFINLILILIIALVIDVGLTVVGLVYLFFVLATVFIWALGIAFVTSIITVRVRDLKNIVELGMFLMNYATPVFYSLNSNIVSNDTVVTLIEINPLTVFMNQMRAALSVYGEISFGLMCVFFVGGVVFTTLTYHYFSHKVKKVAEYF